MLLPLPVGRCVQAELNRLLLVCVPAGRRDGIAHSDVLTIDERELRGDS